jgi:hypothetical protein
MIKALLRILPVVAAVVGLSALPRAGVAAQAAGSAKCVEASDCRGALPRMCMQCGDGHSECAHWTCVRHSCTIQTCPKM